VTLTQGTDRLLGLCPDRIGDMLALLAETAAHLRSPDGWGGYAVTRVAEILVRDLIGA
jgi:hypothetical protein